MSNLTRVGRSTQVLRASTNFRMNMFFFPCAGGTANSYMNWATEMPDYFSVSAIELPGRGRRFNEAAAHTLDKVVSDICDDLASHRELPYAFFGHSLGALLAFEVTRELRRRSRNLPAHLFVAGRIAPQVERRKPSIHTLPDEDFIAELCAIGGIPAELLREKELIDLLLPALRADVRMHETYCFRYEEPLECAITAFGGSADADVSMTELQAWQFHTAGEFKLYQFDGGHFFLNAVRSVLIEIIREKLSVSR